jgi:murein DD-endopeptidase MepM/ murein hydrolase activator NlpD
MLRSVYDTRAAGALSGDDRPLRRTAVTLAALLLAVTVPLSASVADATSTQTDERTRRAEIRAEKARAAGEIDALSATDAELEAAVATLQGEVRAQEAVVADAERAVQQARDEADRLQQEQRATEDEIERLRDEVRDRAIATYAGSDPASMRGIAEADPTDTQRRLALLEAVQGSDRDTLDRLRGATARLESQRDSVAVALAEAEAREAEADRQLDALAAARDAEARKQAELRTRIAEFQAEVDALAAEEAELDRIIAERQAAEQRRRQEAAQRSLQRTSGPRRSNGQSSTPVTLADSGPPPPSASGLSWPCNGTVTSGFGQRWGRLHAGVDIAAPTGTPIYAAKGGTVIHAGPQGGYGNLVLIDHGDGFVTAYAHQSQIATSVGASLSQGQLLGYVGSTGRSTGPHLHFETRVNGSARDPMGFY